MGGREWIGAMLGFASADVGKGAGKEGDSRWRYGVVKEGADGADRLALAAS